MDMVVPKIGEKTRQPENDMMIKNRSPHSEDLRLQISAGVADNIQTLYTTRLEYIRHVTGMWTNLEGHNLNWRRLRTPKK
jgi:hypothetical protein